MRTILIFFAGAVLLTMGFFGSTGCANIIPPQGGPRDSLPPTVLRVTPRDSTLNFTGNRIVLEFDEFIDAQNTSSILMTPFPASPPSFQAKLRTLTVRLEDTLEANTTYTINFGEAIKDVNEGNVLRNFSYTFSTGPALDSLTFSGNVLVAETGKVDTNMVAVLYRNLEDSAVVRDRPRYLVKLDRTGRFRFNNLPAGTFALYAFGDANSRRYPGRNQLFAFADSPIVVRSGAAPVTLNAFRETPTAPPGTPGIGTPGGGPGRQRGGTDNRLVFTANAQGAPLDLLSNYVLTFEQPLSTYDSTRLSLTTDTTFQATTYTTTLDSTRKRLTVQSTWKPGTRYNLVLDQAFAEDTLGRRLLKSDTLFFTTRRAEEYASLSLRIRNIDVTQNPVLQFVQNGVVVRSGVIRDGRFTEPLFLPGDYELRILYDRNGNGKWDSGQFFGEKRQPELVRPVERRINVKANFDNEIEIGL